MLASVNFQYKLFVEGIVFRSRSFAVEELLVLTVWASGWQCPDGGAVVTVHPLVLCSTPHLMYRIQR